MSDDSIDSQIKIIAILWPIAFACLACLFVLWVDLMF